jgi:hypothetical protein
MPRYLHIPHTPDRNAVTLSIAVGSQNLRIGRKGKRETTLKGSPNTANGAPLQGAYITPYMVSVGAPAAYPRLLRGDGFTVLPRMTTTPKRNPTATRPQRGHPLNSRGSERPADSKRKGKRTPAGCPTTQMGDPSRVDIPSTILPGVLRTPRLLRGDGFTVFQPYRSNFF